MSDYVIDAGRLNRRVTFQRKKVTLDSFGQPSTGWDDVVTVWASIRPLSTKEIMAAESTEAQITHEVVVRYQQALAGGIDVAAWRIKYGARVFNIQAPRDMGEAHALLSIACTEGSISGE